MYVSSLTALRGFKNASADESFGSDFRMWFLDNTDNKNHKHLIQSGNILCLSAGFKTTSDACMSVPFRPLHTSRIALTVNSRSLQLVLKEFGNRDSRFVFTPLCVSSQQLGVHVGHRGREHRGGRPRAAAARHAARPGARQLVGAQQSQPSEHSVQHHPPLPPRV